MTRIGLVGGTFNPIHHGHLFLASSASHQFGLERVWFIPNRVPPHKPAPQVSDQQRLEMLELALQERPQWEISRVELDHPEVSYTVDTLRRLPPEHSYYFLTGTDALMVPWKNLDGVLEQLEGLVAANRPGTTFERLQEHLESLGLRHRERVLRFDIPPLAISSSEIRSRVSQGQPVDYLLPSSVLTYIRQNQLYLSGSVANSKDP